MKATPRTVALAKEKGWKKEDTELHQLQEWLWQDYSIVISTPILKGLETIASVTKAHENLAPSLIGYGYKPHTCPFITLEEGIQIALHSL